MGLDMYLSKRIWIGANYEHNKVSGKISLKKHKTPIKIDIKKLKYVIEEVGYWRKANAIHLWFVNNCQNGVDDCKEYYVSKEKIEELLSLCKKVMDVAITKTGKVSLGFKYTTKGEKEEITKEGKIIINSDEIEKLLPTTSGFFFGSTEYDEYYLEDIRNTIEICEKALAENDDCSDFYYSSSW
jgi:hypothetical protein